jgi:tRNA threonylcarbamoyladenosine biosynthesis protein TsaE
MSHSIRLVTASPEETQEVGRAIGRQALPGDILLLTGPLGAGKTCLTQGIAWGLEVAAHPRSPTFVLITRYQGRLTLHHMDLYRINDPLEAWDLGLEEYLSGDGVCVIEWADQAEELFAEEPFAEEALWIDLDYPSPTEAPEALAGESPAGDRTGLVEPPGTASPRRITFGRHSRRYDSLLTRLSRQFPRIEINC